MRRPVRLLVPLMLPLMLSLMAMAMTVLGASTPLAAEERIDCADPSSTVEMNHCAGLELETADKALNAVYQAALKAIPGMAMGDDMPNFNAKAWEKALRESQRAWVAYRDAECDGHTPMFWTGGSGTASAVLGCRSRMTKERTNALKQHYEIR